ncbi:ribonuclease H-like domain-containing protein [Kickxella alabastrina]|uniref:ribonuclease H-like domain-containing protein n=1 Tax=Kickxella alabastrina TaxID=61397 RepID=UPI002220EE1E|nr:ribonuclease H-like domain-containing protein [Kickxella alabastrina]KAI7827847.1 ribonuclease H-like domain-containing protein [Kickxella alabastrina]
MGQKASSLIQPLLHKTAANSAQTIGDKQLAARPINRRFKSRSTAPLIWIDVETTGLTVEKDVILEVAMVITDGELNQLGPPQSLVIARSPEELCKLNPWSLNMHTKSGLLKEVAESKLTLAVAEQELLKQIVQHSQKPGTAILAGNNVGFDRVFISKYMPVLANYLHFRNIDVSTVNELAKRWAPDMLGRYKKTYSHRAIDDINESLRELRYYKNNMFSPRE